MGTGNQGEKSPEKILTENVGPTGGPLAEQSLGNENVDFYIQKSFFGFQETVADSLENE